MLRSTPVTIFLFASLLLGQAAADDNNELISDTIKALDITPSPIFSDGFEPLADSDLDGIPDIEDYCPEGDTGWTSEPGTDHDGDGCQDSIEDPDDDNDGVSDVDEIGAGTNPLDERECGDSDLDTCDDCSVTGDLADDGPDADPFNDGDDYEGDGHCDLGDIDDDNDGRNDGSDHCPFGVIEWDSTNPLEDYDQDGCQDSIEDPDDDNDGVSDVDEIGAGTNPLDERECGDSDLDTCDDCSVTGDLADDGPDADPFNDGDDYNADGQCDAIDPPPP